MPELSIDASGNFLNSEEPMPLLQYSVEGARNDEGIEAENESVGVEEVVEEMVEAQNEGVGVEEGVENEG
ncbi:UNVERIFIED_CONTAM: hypothetical protein Sradi_0200100 [Sesamum radiatum]|uniref:Uncharacterized protein n=1 Tax=Sesamum radiatum TaxID=300843 RepID=A0AAW2VZB9_SESRA